MPIVENTPIASGGPGSNLVPIIPPFIIKDTTEQVNSFNNEYAKYTKIYSNENPENQNIKNMVEPTIINEIKETEQILNREYSLLFVWFIIAILILVLTVVSIISNELTGYILYPSLAFLILIIFYIIKNIYIYFNELI
jgi:hypothetical protein